MDQNWMNNQPAVAKDSPFSLYEGEIHIWAQYEHSDPRYGHGHIEDVTAIGYIQAKRLAGEMLERLDLPVGRIFIYRPGAGGVPYHPSELWRPSYLKAIGQWTEDSGH